MRIRHLHLRSHLVESGWRVHTENGLGIAVRDVGPSGLDEVVRSLASRDVGWFFAFGEWARLGTLLQAPLRKTMDLFCRNHRIAPSLEFLEGAGKYDGAFAYCSVGDDREPAVHLISSRQVGSALSECFALEESRE